MLVVVCARVFVGGLYGNPKRFVWRMVALSFSGNSLGFRGWGRSGWIIAHSETLNVHFSGCVVGRFLDMGKPLPLFAVMELGEVVLHGWKPRLYAMVKLRGAFVGIWKLERIVWARKNLGLWRGWKRFGDLRDIWKLRGALLRVWKLGTLAHTKLSVCIRGLVELWWLRGGCGTWSAFGGGCMSLGGCIVMVVRWSFFFSAFRETRWLLSFLETSVFAFVYIFRSVGGVLSGGQHRAVGGSSDGGVKGIPLNNPLFG